jgi:hypothetical protein
MKGGLTIYDREYETALNILHGELECRGIRYAVIGGGSVQIHIAAEIEDHIAHKKMLRKTGDIDIVIDAPLEEQVLLFNELVQGGYASANEMGSAQFGRVVVNYIAPEEVKGFGGIEEELIFSETEYRQLPHGGDICVTKPEQTIAAKLTGSYKLKDVTDIKRLLVVFKDRIDEAKLIRFLELLGKPEKFETYRSLLTT